MKALVTGGAGFIGSHLVETLVKKNWEVVVVDNLGAGRLVNLAQVQSRIRLHKADISEPGDWVDDLKGCDVVFHLAALVDVVPSMNYPAAYFKSNVDGAFCVGDMCRQAGVKRIVYTGSSSCYGFQPTYPTPETANPDLRYPYALTKWLGEQSLIHLSKMFQIPTISLRLFSVYGPRARTTGSYGAVLGVFLAQKMAKKPLTIVGDGTQVRDFVHVKDVVRALVMAAETPCEFGVFNVGTGTPTSINRIAELIGGERVYIPNRPGEAAITHADIRAIQAKLGWSPEVTIEQGLLETLANMSHWKDAPVWTPDKIARETEQWFKHLTS